PPLPSSSRDGSASPGAMISGTPSSFATLTLACASRRRSRAPRGRACLRRGCRYAELEAEREMERERLEREREREGERDSEREREGERERRDRDSERER